jgi:biopolymer transport protein ExbD
MTTLEDAELRAEINVTPLVDVVLVLLVILLLLAPMLRDELPVELPVARSAAEPGGAAVPTLTIAADGGVSFDGTPLPSSELAARLAAVYRERREKSVLLAADRRLPYARVVEVIDACRAAGIERIGVVTGGDGRASGGGDA